MMHYCTQWRLLWCLTCKRHAFLWLPDTDRWLLYYWLTWTAGPHCRWFPWWQSSTRSSLIAWQFVLWDKISCIERKIWLITERQRWHKLIMLHDWFWCELSRAIYAMPNLLTRLKSSRQIAIPSGPTPIANLCPSASRTQCHSTP